MIVQNRNRAIDVAKAIGIILVVIGHIPGLYGPLWSAIYSFHMPLFFIMAGAVYVQREPMQVLVRGAKKLLIPYAVVIGICVLMAFLFGNYGRVHSYALGLLFPDGNRGDYDILASWPSVEAMWFFPAMFCCRWLYSLIAKYVKNNIIAVCAIIQLVCVIIGRCFINLPFGLLAGSSVLFFFAIGPKIVDFAGGGVFATNGY